MKKINEAEWGDLECLYNACHIATTVGGLFTYTGTNEWVDDEWQEWKWQWDAKRAPVQEARELTEVGSNRFAWKWLLKDERFEFRVKLTRGEGKKRTKVQKIDDKIHTIHKANLISHQTRTTRPNLMVALLQCTVGFSLVCGLRKVLRLLPMTWTMTIWEMTLGLTWNTIKFINKRGSSTMDLVQAQHILKTWQKSSKRLDNKKTYSNFPY